MTARNFATRCSSSGPTRTKPTSSRSPNCPGALRTEQRTRKPSSRGRMRSRVGSTRPGSGDARSPDQESLPGVRGRGTPTPTAITPVAYRMLGSLSEADDAVQESWLHLSRSDSSGVKNLGGWLTTVVARVCLDMLRSRKSRREEPLDAHVPDPIVSRADGIDPEHTALLADSVGLALLVVLDRLSPAERIVPGRRQAAGEPRTPPGTGRGHGPRRRSRPPARSCRRLLRCRARG